MQAERTTIPTAKIALNIGQIPDVPQNPRFIKDERFEALKKSITDDPEMLSLRELIVYPLAKNDGEKTFVVIGGNMRFRACRELGYTEIPCVILPEETPPEKLRAVLIKDNISHGELDWEILANEFERDELKNFGLELDEKELFSANAPEETVPLADKYIVPPFSVFDSRQGYWQARKKEWRSRFCGTAGRCEDLIGGGGLQLLSAKGGGGNNGTSEFDPVLCEAVIRWFSGRNGKVLDPFAGGAALGVVSTFLGRKFTGIDIRQEQVDADNEQWNGIGDAKDIYGDALGAPHWICGDSAKMDKVLPEKEKFDLIFSCPPYGDLEVYSQLDGDFSNMEHTKFLATFREVAKHCFTRLENDAFCAMLVGDFRDNKGILRNFVSDTIGAFTDAGFKLYNEIILVTPIAAAALRAQRIFGSTRKTVKTHQNLLVFLKGEEALAKDKCELAPEEELTLAMFDALSGFTDEQILAKAHQNLLVFLKGDARKATAKCEHIDEAQMEKLVDETTVVERLTNEED